MEGEETRGVVEVTLRLPAERRPTLSRPRLGNEPLALRDFAQRELIDEAILAGVDQRWNEYRPGVTREVREDEPDDEIVEILDVPFKQQIVKSFRRLEEEPEEVFYKLKVVPGLGAPLAAALPVPWWTAAPPFNDWSLRTMRTFREERKVWLFCDAAKQRRIMRRTETELEENFSDRLKAKAQREQEKRLADKFSDLGSRKGKKAP